MSETCTYEKWDDDHGYGIKEGDRVECRGSAAQHMRVEAMSDGDQNIVVLSAPGGGYRTGIATRGYAPASRIVLQVSAWSKDRRYFKAVQLIRYDKKRKGQRFWG